MGIPSLSVAQKMKTDPHIINITKTNTKSKFHIDSESLSDAVWWRWDANEGMEAVIATNFWDRQTNQRIKTWRNIFDQPGWPTGEYANARLLHSQCFPCSSS